MSKRKIGFPVEAYVNPLNMKVYSFLCKESDMPSRYMLYPLRKGVVQCVGNEIQMSSICRPLFFSSNDSTFGINQRQAPIKGIAIYSMDNNLIGNLKDFILNQNTFLITDILTTTNLIIKVKDYVIEQNPTKLLLKLIDYEFIHYHYFWSDVHNGKFFFTKTIVQYDTWFFDRPYKRLSH